MHRASITIVTINILFFHLEENRIMYEKKMDND